MPASPHRPLPASAPAPLCLSEDDARAVLFVRAAEESDPDGAALPLRARREATDAALEALAAQGSEAAEQPARFLAERARRLLLLRGEEPPRAWRVPPALFAAVALGFGLSTNLLGGGRTIHVLWNPVVGLVAWSLAIYAAVLLWRPLSAAVRRRATSDAPATAPAASPLVALLLRARAWIEARGSKEPGTALERRARFAAAWERAALGLRLARARLALHVGAGLIALGALGGMYLRGLAFAYSASWESTFLSDAGAERVLRVLLAPALLVRGAELPDLAAIRAPASAPAAPWVHLFAWTVVLVVLVPRALLAWRELRSARRLAGAIRIDAREPYFRRLLAPARGESSVARVVPYGRALSSDAAERLRALLGELLGARAEIALEPPAEYGADGATLFASDAASDGRARTLVVVFPLAQTPEGEVHGRFLTELRQALEADETMLVLVDDAGYRARLGAQAPERLPERRLAWDRVAAAEGLSAAHVDLDQPQPDAAASELERALWTPAR